MNGLKTMTQTEYKDVHATPGEIKLNFFPLRDPKCTKCIYSSKGSFLHDMSLLNLYQSKSKALERLIFHQKGCPDYFNSFIIYCNIEL